MCVLCVQGELERPQSWGLLNMKNVLLLRQPEDTQESNSEHMDCINSITNHNSAHIHPLITHTRAVTCMYTLMPTEVSLCANQQAMQQVKSGGLLV